MATKPKRVTYDDTIDDNADYLVPLQDEPKPSRSNRRPPPPKKPLKPIRPGGCYGSCYFLTSIILYASVPIVQFIIGLIYINRCTVQQFTPIYMILSGIFGIAFFVVALIIYINIRRQISLSRYVGASNRPASLRILVPVFIILLLFVLGWWIAGQVVVFQVKLRVDLTFPDLPEYCHPTLYQAAYTLIFIDYLIGFIVIIFIILYCAIPYDDDDDEEEIVRKKRPRRSGE